MTDTIKIATADETLLCLGEELDRAWERERKLIREENEHCDDGYNAARDASSTIVSQIEKHKAHTLEGFRVKARAVMWCHSWHKIRLTEHRTTDHPADRVHRSRPCGGVTPSWSRILF
jgi:hypothetical protein